jgi:sulfoquinovose isomerase
MEERSGEPNTNRGWLSSPAHRAWLLDQAQHLIGFYQYACPDPEGGFFELGENGAPQSNPVRSLVVTARMVHNFSLAHLLGRPGAGPLADHGIRFLQEAYRDRTHGGYFWEVDHEGPRDTSKQAYGHAFVLLAASSALMAQRAGAAELLSDIWSALDTHFWSEADGLVVEEFKEDWTPLSPYRGQNCNMHLVEALLTAAEATHNPLYLQRALRIAERLIRDLTAGNNWRLAEHYTAQWQIDTEYNREDPENMYRPFGSVIGHWPEWSRLLLQIHALSAAPPEWLLPAARRLFDAAMDEGWDQQAGGLAYTVDFDGKVLNTDHYQWPISEAISAAARLIQVTADPRYEHWYRTLWDYADGHIIDHARGGWYYVMDGQNRPKNIPGVVTGKPDLYHALQSCLVPLLPADAGIGASLRDGKLERVLL